MRAVAACATVRTNQTATGFQRGGLQVDGPFSDWLK
jgi:hypothetical protein